MSVQGVGGGTSSATAWELQVRSGGETLSGEAARAAITAPAPAADEAGSAREIRTEDGRTFEDKLMQAFGWPE